MSHLISVEIDAEVARRAMYKLEDHDLDSDEDFKELRVAIFWALEADDG